jgi:hypothetical protein
LTPAALVALMNSGRDEETALRSNKETGKKKGQNAVK